MVVSRWMSGLLFVMALNQAPDAWGSSAAPASKASEAACAVCAAATTGKPLVASAAVSDLMVLICGAVIVAGCVAVLWLAARSFGDERARRWRLSDALSEEVNYTDASGNTTTLLTASSSRLIAVLGLIVILALYIGMGLLALHAFAAGNATPSVVDTMLKFLAGGGALFVPYLANQVRAGLEKKSALPVPTSDTPSTPAKVLMPALPAGPKV